MKSAIPPANALIATLYLFFIIAIAYLAKLLFRKEAQPSTHKQTKYSPNNMLKGLSNPSINENISPVKIALKSFALKYSIVGTFVNQQKFYLFKEVFVIAVICVACRVINRITLWPIALTIVFSSLFFVALQVFKLPFVLNISRKVQQQSKNSKEMIDHIEIQPSFPIIGLSEHGKQQIEQKQRKLKPTHTHKFMLCVAVMLFVILLLVSETMFTIYNSVSNLGALNIESLILTVLIDQLLVRPFFAGTIVLAIKLILHKFQTSAENSSNAHKVKFTKTRKLFKFAVLRNLCKDLLIQEMNNIHITLGEPSDTKNVSSANKKKIPTPSKVSKTQPAFAESETMMEIEKADMVHERERKRLEEKVEEFRSPIKALSFSIMKHHETALFTSIEKRMFGEELQTENNQREVNKNKSTNSISKAKGNPNQFFSIQRLPKQELTYCEQKIEDEDGLVLVGGGFDLIKNKCNGKKEPNSFEFDVCRKKKQHGRQNNKRRQLIITGSSPYLEYLPDMMKKERLLRKGSNTPTQPYLQTAPKQLR